MALLTLRNVCVSYGGPLLDHVNFSIDKGERVSLIGRNGAGKSTLMKLIAREIFPDDGEVVSAEGVRVAKLDQEVPLATEGLVFDVVASGLGAVSRTLVRFHELAKSVAMGADALVLRELEQCQHELEAHEGWGLHNRVVTLLSKLDLPGDSDVQALSGGLKRRVLLARALVAEPDLLLLDEPTNHLDLESITALEAFLLDWPGTLIFVSHDRAFLQRLATRIVELDRALLYDWPGDYQNYLRRKDELLNAEAKQNSEFDKRLAQEEAWIREGIKARRTRNMGRVRRLYEMRAERSARRSQLGQVKLGIQRGEASGKLVLEAEDVTFSYGGTRVIQAFSTVIQRGDKVGIIGPNGCGKTTLLRIMLGDLQPSTGVLRMGTNLRIAYFDQYRSQLDESASVVDNVAGGSDRVTFNGRNTHVISYLKDFLFTAERARQPVSALSGGERNRLLLARLFSQPANLLVLDEPTNDLDAETLELLEELLIEYDGTILLVSHDRAFIDNVVTNVLVFEGEGVVADYVGGYDDWQRQRAVKQVDKPTPQADQTPVNRPTRERTKRMGFKELRELEGLPAKIEELETELEQLTEAMANGAFYQQAKDAISKAQGRLTELEELLAAAYTRWDELEALREA